MTTNNNNNNNFDDDDYDDDVKLPPAAAAAVVKNNNDNNSNDTDTDNVDYLSSSLSLCLLPNEIMKRITMYLPSNDAINFSLSSKHIKSCLVLAVLPSRKFNVNSRVFVGGQRRRDGGGGGGGGGGVPPRRGRGDNNNLNNANNLSDDDVVNNKQPKEAFRIPLLYNQSSNTVQAHSVTLSINWCMLPPFLDDQGINHNNAIRRDPNNANNNNNNQPVTRKIWLIGRQKDMERRTMMTSMTDDQLYNHNINIHQHQEGRHENNIMNDDDDDDDILLQKPPPPSSLPPFDGGRIVYEFTSTISLRQSDRGAPEHLRIPFTPEENEVYEIWCGCGGCGTIDDPSGDQQQQQQIQPTPHNTFYFRDLKIDTLIFDFDTDYTFSHNYKSMLNAEIAFTQRRFLSEYGVHYNNNSNNNNGRPRPRQGPGFGGSNMIARNDMLPSKTSFMGDLLLSTCQSLRQRLEATTTSSSSSSSNEQPPPAIDPIMSSFLDQYGILKSVASFRCIEDMIQTERNDREYSEMRHQQRQQQGNNNNRNNGANGNGDGVAGGGGGAFVGGNITITVNGRVIGEDQQLHQFNIGEGQPLNFGGVGGNNNNGPGQPQVFVHRVGGGGGGGGAARGAGGAGLAGLGGGLGAFLNGIINGGAGGGGGEQQQQQEEQQAQQQQQNDRVEQAAAVAAAAAAANDDDDDEIGVVVDVDMEEEEREDRQQEANEQRQNNGPNGIAAVHDAAAAAHQAAAAAQEAAAAAQAAANAAQEAARGQHQEQGIPREAGAGAGGGAGNNPDMNDILGGIPPEVQNMLPPGLLENIIMGDGTGVGGGIAVGGGFRPPPHQQAAAGAGAQNDDDDDDDEEEGPQAEVHVVEVPIHIPDGGGNPNININLPGGAFDGGAQPQVFFGGAQMFGGGPGGGDIPPEAEGMIFQQIAQMMAGNGGNMAMGGMGMGAFPFPPPPPPQNDDDDSIPEID